ncbi:MAG: amidohydrolase family protein [Bacteroidota bacterium]
MKISHFIIILILFNGMSSCEKNQIDADILIKNGIVYNGVDTIPIKLSIAIQDDKIIYIGDASKIIIYAKKIIDASGLIVCPGFIDPHTHADRDLIDPKKSHNKPFLFQGVTTVVVGNDGNSFFPTKKYKDLFENQGIGTNAILLTGQGTIRGHVIGKSDQKATTEDIIKMQDLIQQEMDAGSFGMSTGLFYAPGSYADTEEVIALAKTVAKNNGIYDTHLRDESSFSIGIIDAVEEAIEIGRQAKLPIHISHIKCLGVDVWNQSIDIIKLIEEGKAEGINITANQYPYGASATSLKAAVVPRWAESGGKDSLFLRYNHPKFKNRILEETKKNIVRRGGPEKLLIVKIDDAKYLGKNLLEISEMIHLPAEQAVYVILKNNYAIIASFNMNNNDILNFMKQPWVVTGSDGNTGHPRKYGTFPRKYHKYVQQEKVIDLASFINGSTSKTADIFKIPNRGELKKDYFADIIIFNPKTFKDKADYSNAFQLAEGLEYSIINGKISVENGKFTETLNGKVLTKK